MADKEQNSISCSICATAPLIRKKMRGTDVLYCPACSGLFSPPDVLADSAYYQEQYTLLREHTDFSAERRNIERLSEQWKYLHLLQQHHPKAQSILDIGCDRGYFLDAARRAGFVAEGVELSQQARSYAETLGCTVFSSTDEIPQQQRYDALTMWHVLEHIPNPVEMLRSVSSIHLNEGAVVMIRVPDAMSFVAKLLGKKWVWFQPEHHVNHFSNASLRRCLELAGFEVLLLQSQFASSWHTCIGHLHALATERQARPQNSTVSSMSYSFARYVWHHATGCELFAIARRRASI